MEKKTNRGRAIWLGCALSLLATRAIAAPIASTSIDVNVAMTAGNTDIVRTLELPDIAALHSVTIGLAHTYAFDLWIGLTAPDGTVFTLAQSAFVAGSLGLSAGSGALSNVADYTFQESGNTTAWGPLSGGLYSSANGPFSAVTWFSGPYSAGTWTLRVTDTFPSLDFGSIGSVTLNYLPDSGPGGPVTVPTPSTLALMSGALFALFGIRRRRPAT